MYEELVKRMRAVTDGSHEDKCDGCPYDEDYPCCVDCLDTMLKQAADAIEELIEVIKNHNFLESLIKPRWIPVTERLPEKRKWVLCRCEANIIEVLRWENNEWYHDPLHVYYPSFVTHWMPLPPLPEPPKEEALPALTIFSTRREGRAPHDASDRYHARPRHDGPAVQPLPRAGTAALGA